MYPKIIIDFLKVNHNHIWACKYNDITTQKKYHTNKLNQDTHRTMDNTHWIMLGAKTLCCIKCNNVANDVFDELTF